VPEKASLAFPKSLDGMMHGVFVQRGMGPFLSKPEEAMHGLFVHQAAC
jgi:hypothetical protein